jgi:hypothetical protein
MKIKNAIRRSSPSSPRPTIRSIVREPRDRRAPHPGRSPVTRFMIFATVLASSRLRSSPIAFRNSDTLAWFFQVLFSATEDPACTRYVQAILTPRMRPAGCSLDKEEAPGAQPNGLRDSEETATAPNEVSRTPRRPSGSVSVEILRYAPGAFPTRTTP